MRLASIGVVCAALLIFRGGFPAAAIAADVSPGADVACAGLTPGPVRSVTRVIDGETLALDDGSEVRLIGALAPRAIDVGAEPGAWAPEAATRDALRVFVLGKSIELHFGGDRLDRHGRLQAQAVLVDGERRRWVQGYLLEEGLARAYAIAGNRACASELLAAERNAREAGRGLWAQAAYQVRAADSGLFAYRATFQVIEGRIVRVALVRGTLHLNFARNWRQAFSVSLRDAERTLLGAHAADPKGLEGQAVRVRGWMDVRRGAPMVDLSVAGLIEFTDDPDRSIEKPP